MKYRFGLLVFAFQVTHVLTFRIFYKPNSGTSCKANFSQCGLNNRPLFQPYIDVKIEKNQKENKDNSSVVLKPNNPNTLSPVQFAIMLDM